MDLNQFRAEEKLILDRYRQKLGKAISYDGLIDPELYFSDRVIPKLLFVLQMPVEESGEQNEDWIEFIDWIKDGCDNRWQTWDSLARWIYAIYNKIDPSIWFDHSKLRGRDFRKKWLRLCAIVNINKCADKVGRNERKIMEAAKRCSKELNDQITLYKPDWIICCGTGSGIEIILDKRNDWKKTKACLWYTDVFLGKHKTKVIQHLHPQMRLGEDLKTCLLLSSIKEITGNQ